jgi:hypothetical protein
MIMPSGERDSRDKAMVPIRIVADGVGWPRVGWILSQVSPCW